MHSDVLSLEPAVILGISIPEALFTKPSPDVVEAEHKALARKWHPDLNPGMDKVFAHINTLKDAAIDKLSKGVWEAPGVYRVRTKEGTNIEFHYQKRTPFDLGEMVICQEAVAYIFDPGNDDFYQNAVESLSSFKYASDRMREECERYVPKIKRQIVLADGRKVLLLSKTKDLIRLRDLLEHQGGKIDPLHVAWIQSSLHNLACYLGYTGLVHADISPDTYFVTPEFHSGVLIGGWWFTRRKNAKLLGASPRTINLMPPAVLKDKLAVHKLDLELIRATGREILGDPTGVRLRSNKGIPTPLIEFTQGVSSGKAHEDYTAWSDALKAAYGKRKFVKFNVTPAQVYGTK